MIPSLLFLQLKNQMDATLPLHVGTVYQMSPLTPVPAQQYKQLSCGNTQVSRHINWINLPPAPANTIYEMFKILEIIYRQRSTSNVALILIGHLKIFEALKSIWTNSNSSDSSL